MEIPTTAPIRLNAHNLPFELIDAIAKFVGCIKLYKDGVWWTQFPKDDPRREIVSRRLPVLYNNRLPNTQILNFGRFLIHPNSQLFAVRYTLFPDGKYCRFFKNNAYCDARLESNIYRDMIFYYKGNKPPLHILIKCDGTAVEYILGPVS